MNRNRLLNLNQQLNKPQIRVQALILVLDSGFISVVSKGITLLNVVN